MKKLSLLLALVILAAQVSLPALAEEAPIVESASGFCYIEAAGSRPRLSAASGDKFIRAEGEYFKDLNASGTLEPYEDWRLPAAERVADLLSRMSLPQKAGTLAFGAVGGRDSITVTDFSAVSLMGGQVPFIRPDAAQMNNDTDPFITVDQMVYAPVAWQIRQMHETAMFAALDGMPRDQLEVLNRIQAIAEDTALGIPVTLCTSRAFNTWGGMVDMPRYALGVARDEELLRQLCGAYAREAAALGYHLSLNAAGLEPGSFFGDTPAYIARMAAAQTRACSDSGIGSLAGCFLAGGGRGSYADAWSPADLLDNWLTGWRAVVDAGVRWIMLGDGIGRTPGLPGFTDRETCGLLRHELGFDGVVCMMWPPAASLADLSGVTADQVDLSTLTLGERYTLILDTGVDMFSCYGCAGGTAPGGADEALLSCFHPEAIVAEIEAGRYNEAALDAHVARVLVGKLEAGLFENPYRDWDEAAAVLGGGAADTGLIPGSDEELSALRQPEIREMEERLMVESTILLKNDGILPLTAGQRIYVDSTSADTLERLNAAIGERTAVVDFLDEADVCVIEITAFDDTYEMMMEDALDVGVPVVTIFEGSVTSEPDQQAFRDANALLMQTYNSTPGRGSAAGSFYHYTAPEVTAQMLFGEREPKGKTLFELPYEASARLLSWGELQHDIGVDNQTRLYMAMLAKQQPQIDLPNNLGDVIVTTDYGIRYSQPAEITLSMLTVPRSAAVSAIDIGCFTSTQATVKNLVPPAGEPFEISFVASNSGGAGLVTVQVLDGDAPVAEKMFGLAEGQFRVITVELVLEAGEHIIRVGDMTETIIVE